MELSINTSNHRPTDAPPPPLPRILQGSNRARNRARSSSSPSSASPLHIINITIIIIIILLCLSLVFFNQFDPEIQLTFPPTEPKSPQNPLPIPKFNCTQILQSPFCSSIDSIFPFLSLKNNTTTREQILQLALDMTVTSLKNSNTQVLNLFNRQDLSREHKIVLMFCMDRIHQSINQLELAIRYLNLAIDDLDYFFNFELACRRLKQVDLFLSMCLDDQESCGEQLHHVAVHHGEGSSEEGKDLLKSFVIDLRNPSYMLLGHSLEIAKEMERNCRRKIDQERHEITSFASQMPLFFESDQQTWMSKWKNLQSESSPMIEDDENGGEGEDEGRFRKEAAALNMDYYNFGDSYWEF